MKYEEFGKYDSKVKIAIVIPYRPGNKEIATKAAKLYIIRAGMDCKVYTIEDSEQKGWVNAQNWAFNNLDFDFYIYSCDDYIPCRNFLIKAYQSYLGTQKQVIAFNDGKWDGSMATIALVKKEFAEKLEDGNLFYKGYFGNYGDPELTDHAIHFGEYAYLDNVPFMEIEYEKEVNPHVNQKDRQTYLARPYDYKRFG